MRPDYRSHHHPPLAQDITPYSERFAHIRGGYGANMPIGKLDEEWREEEQEQVEQRNGVMEMVRSVKRPKLFTSAYLQPLGEHGNKLLSKLSAANLYVSYWFVRFKYGVLKPLWAKSKDSVARIAAAASLFMGSLWTKAHLPKLNWFPKKYTADKGLMIDMDTPAMEVTRRVATPLFAAVAMFILLALAWNPRVPFTESPAQPPKQGAPAASAGTDDSKQTTTASNSGPNMGTTATGSGPTSRNGQTLPVTNSSASMPLATTGSAPYLGGTYNPVVGRGGDTSTSSAGGTTSPSTGGSGSGSSLPGIPGVTSPVTTTVPGTTVGAGDKTIISTSPISVTLN